MTGMDRTPKPGDKRRNEPATATGWRARLSEIWLPMGFAIGFFALWEAITVGFGVPRYILPPPSSVIAQLLRNLPRIAEYTVVTGGETLAGFAVALLGGIPFALLIAFSKPLRQTLYPAAVTLEMVPKIAFAPLFVTWFGFGTTPKVIIVFIVCFFPILL